MKKKLEVKNNVLKGGIHYLTSDYKTRNSNRSTHNGIDLIGENGIDEIVAILRIYLWHIVSSSFHVIFRRVLFLHPILLPAYQALG